MLTQRKSIATTEYVFLSNGAGGYIVEPCKQMEKVIQHSGISFIIHDLRRTFITTASALLGREATWEETIEDYKAILEKRIHGKPYNPKPMEGFQNYYKILNEG